MRTPFSPSMSLWDATHYGYAKLNSLGKYCLRHGFLAGRQAVSLSDALWADLAEMRRHGREARSDRYAALTARLATVRKTA